MILTLSKRLRFETAYRLDSPDWTDEQFRRQWGDSFKRGASLGGNFEAYFIFTGPVDEASGMMINVTDIKSRVGRLLSERYDHKYLNDDNRSFASTPPTIENIARQLFDDTVDLFDDTPAQLYACHVYESPELQATAYRNRVARHSTVQFSAARRTCSPHLSKQENTRLFGQAVNDHGHQYDLRVTLEGELSSESGQIVAEREIHETLHAVHQQLDHKHLNDLAELNGLPLTTESLARWLFNRLRESLPVDRIVLAENPWFSVDYNSHDVARINVIDQFRAAHRLHAPYLSDQENLGIFGKCNNPNGHGHRYRVQTGVSGPIDEQSGIMMNLMELVDHQRELLNNWNGKFLDRDLDTFRTQASTSENIVTILHGQLEARLGRPVSRLRLWETDNNRFTLRRT